VPFLDLSAMVMKSGERKGAGRPTRAQAAAMDERVLEGARVAFSRLGVTAPLEEIALALGISKHTIYRRFRNRNDLLDAVVRRDIRIFRQTLVDAGDDAEDALDAVKRTALAYHAVGSSPEYSGFYLSLTAKAVLSPELRQQLWDWSRISLEPLVARIAVAQSAGVLAVRNPLAVCEILVDLLEGANNRIRLGPPVAVGDSAAVFDDRWAVFLEAFAPSEPSINPR
jgi:AcrR family transcriptional regulator